VTVQVRAVDEILGFMEDVRPTTADLLEGWREASRAAELAERLAALAAKAAEQADRNSLASEQIATMAEKASRAAERAAAMARLAADRARALANENRSLNLKGADAAGADARAEEASARELYHAGESRAREAHEDEQLPS